LPIRLPAVISGGFAACSIFMGVSSDLVARERDRGGKGYSLVL
jgi:hypothetical protein